jgi:adenylate kinase
MALAKSGSRTPSVAAATPEKPLAVILFGSPGSGKGTQSGLLVEWLAIPQISTGDMLRGHIQSGDAIGRAIASRMHAGSLVSDELVNQMVFERIHQPDCSRGFILDGYPRTMPQAERMAKLLAGVGAEPVVIYLVVDYNVIISRMRGRRVCPLCGTLYNLNSRPPKTEGKCDLDGTTLVVRDDDREEVVRERLQQYEHQTQPLVDFFRNAGERVYEVDGSGRKPEAVFQEIQSDLRELVHR